MRKDFPYFEVKAYILIFYEWDYNARTDDTPANVSPPY
jgi:hypothetical protein